MTTSRLLFLVVDISARAVWNGNLFLRLDGPRQTACSRFVHLSLGKSAAVESPAVPAPAAHALGFQPWTSG
jgi:hypothetical protein